jgi:hypothetical protein
MSRWWIKIGLAAFLASAGISVASWWAGQRPFLTPGNHQVFHEGSEAGALAGFLVFIAAAIPSVAALFGIHDRNFREAAHAGRVCVAIMAPYLAALTLASLLTPATVVNIGDSYCMDIWCLGINQVNATPRSQDILYTAEVAISVYSKHPHRFPAKQATDLFYVLDDQGRRYPLKEASFVDADVTVQPGEPLRSSFEFSAPPSARRLYLAGNDDGVMHLPWVYLYFGSDISLFHRRALLRISERQD